MTNETKWIYAIQISNKTGVAKFMLFQKPAPRFFVPEENVWRHINGKSWKKPDVIVNKAHEKHIKVFDTEKECRDNFTNELKEYIRVLDEKLNDVQVDIAKKKAMLLSKIAGSEMMTRRVK